MAVTLEALQIVIAEMQRQSAENLMQIAQSINATTAANNSNRAGGFMTDSRGIGRPISFKGEEAKYAE